MQFSRQEYWSGFLCPPLGDLPDPGIELVFPALQSDSLPLSHRGSPTSDLFHSYRGKWQLLVATCKIHLSHPSNTKRFDPIQHQFQAQHLIWISSKSSMGWLKVGFILRKKFFSICETVKPDKLYASKIQVKRTFSFQKRERRKESQASTKPTKADSSRYFFFNLNFFILITLGLCCCMRAFSRCGEQGLLFVVVHRL